MDHLAQVLNYVKLTSLNKILRTAESGSFSIVDGILTGYTNNYKVGQYIVIKGSILNDDLYLVNAEMKLENAVDEKFTGIIYGLVVPRQLILLAEQVKKYEEANPIEKSNIVSQSWGGWSESKGRGANGAVVTWQELFSKQLAPYKQMFAEVII